MEQPHSRSRKRANPLDASPNESLCHCSCHHDRSRDYGPSPKRQREKTPRFPLAPSDEFAVCSSDSPHTVQNGDYIPIHTQTNIDVNVVEDDFSFLPAGRPPDSQHYLGITNQTFPQLAAEINTNRTAETSPTCTASNDTLDTNDGTTRSQDGANEELLASSEEYGLGVGNVWPWNTSDNNMPPFGDLGRNSFYCVVCA